MLERISGWSRKRKIIVGCLVGIVILLVISAIVSGFESEESKAARAEATAVAVQAKEAEEAEKRKSGLHCLSPFDGNHGGLEELVKDNLTDPGSLEVIETTVSAANENGKNGLFMDFTAKNALGGRVRYMARAVMDNESCEATLVTIDQS